VASASADSVSAGVVVSADPSSSRGGRSASFDSVAASPNQASAAPDAAPERPVTKLAANTAQAPQIVESAGGAGSYFVQIAARNDQEAAVAAFVGLQQKYAGVLGNYSPSVRKVDLGDKGVWYRLLVGPVESKTEADELCERLKGAGMKSCFSRKD
jgi:cell division protein FtsN